MPWRSSNQLLGRFDRASLSRSLETPADTPCGCLGLTRKVTGQTGPRAAGTAVTACLPPGLDGECRGTTAKDQRLHLRPPRGTAPTPDAASRPPRPAARKVPVVVELRTNGGSAA